jgi:hypothetical protein
MRQCLLCVVHVANTSTALLLFSQCVHNREDDPETAVGTAGVIVDVSKTADNVSHYRTATTTAAASTAATAAAATAAAVASAAISTVQRQ